MQIWQRTVRPATLILLLHLSLAFAVETADAGEPDFLLGDWEVSLKQKNLVNSHTSYEFGNPFPPYQVPLSRLEFPINTFWGGIEVRKQFSRFSFDADFLSTLTPQDAGGQMYDSDWEDDNDPQRLSIFSSSACRMQIGYEAGTDLDIQVADLLQLPEGFFLRPLIGFRWQHLHLITHDGIQYMYAPDGSQSSELLPGNGIDFQQDWFRYILGLRFGYEWHRLGWLYSMKLNTQLDWSYVTGYNLDHHLLRDGNRLTEEKTSGDGWHASMGLLMGLSPRVNLGIEADYLSIQTTGTHTLRNDPYGILFSFKHGVKAWSEQYGITVKMGLRF